MDDTKFVIFSFATNAFTHLIIIGASIWNGSVGEVSSCVINKVLLDHVF